MAKGQLVAAKALGILIKGSSSHSGTHVAGIILSDLVDDIENTGLIDFYGNLQEFAVFLEKFSDLLVVPWVHGDELHFKVHLLMLFQFLKKLR